MTTNYTNPPTGRPWRRDGDTVTLKLQMPHDQLEIYSTRGEYLCSYPVQSTGEVKIDNLEARVYLLYMQGRRIVWRWSDGGSRA